MKIDISLLIKHEAECFEAQEDFDGFDIYDDAEALSPIKLHTKAWYDQLVIHIHLDVAYKLKMTCSRCLKQFEEDYQLTYEEEFTIEQLTEMYPAATFDSMELVREAIILKIPFKKLCDEACEGLAYRSFEEEEEDEVFVEGNPHFDKLKTLLEKADKEV